MRSKGAHSELDQEQGDGLGIELSTTTWTYCFLSFLPLPPPPPVSDDDQGLFVEKNLSSGDRLMNMRMAGVLSKLIIGVGTRYGTLVRLYYYGTRNRYKYPAPGQCQPVGDRVAAE